MLYQRYYPEGAGRGIPFRKYPLFIRVFCDAYLIGGEPIAYIKNNIFENITGMSFVTPIAFCLGQNFFLPYKKY